jgi:cell division protein FtsW
MSIQAAASPFAASMPDRRALLRLWLGRLLAVFAILLVWGAAAVFSTTVYQRIALDEPDPYKDFLKHLCFIVLGLSASGALVFAAHTFRPIRGWARRLIPMLYAGSLVLVAMVTLTKFGLQTGFAHLTLQLGSLRFQPSELMKLTTVMYLAMLLCWWRDMAGLEKDKRPRGTSLGDWLQLMFRRRQGRPAWPDLPRRVVIVLLLPVFFTLMQKDMGSASIILGTGLITILLAGVDWRQLVVCAVLTVLLGTTGVILKPDYVAHAWSRLTVYWALLHNQPVNQDGDAFQITQSRGALAMGGLTGRGYLHSEQKMNRLPVCTEDFVYPIMVEEFGFVGGVGIMLLFLAVAWCGVNLANACQDPFNRSVVGALGLSLCMQAFVNIGTTIGTLPVTGITLPFFSEGGTSIVVSILAIGAMAALALTELLPDKKSSRSGRFAC